MSVAVSHPATASTASPRRRGGSSTCRPSSRVGGSSELDDEACRDPAAEDVLETLVDIVELAALGHHPGAAGCVRGSLRRR